MYAIVAVVLLVTAIANPLAVVAFAAFIWGFVLAFRVGKATGSSWLLGLTAMAWWGSMSIITTKLMTAHERWKTQPWCKAATDILGNAHVAGICLFWVGLICLYFWPGFDDYARHHELSAFLLCYALMAVVSAALQTVNHLWRHKASPTDAQSSV